jgi:hypothetical protein
MKIFRIANFELGILTACLIVGTGAFAATYSVDTNAQGEATLTRDLPQGTTKAQLVQSIVNRDLRERRERQQAEDLQLIRVLLDLATNPAKVAARNALVASIGVPAVTNPGAQSSLVNDVVSLQIVATDADSQTLIYSAKNLPAGLTLNPETGLISGTVNAPGVHSVDVVVTKLGLIQTAINFNWTVT